MKRPPLHPQEASRLEALYAANILDTPPEAPFDRVARLAAQITGCPIALFSLVDRDRQWFKSVLGLSASETGRDESFCAHAVASESTLIVPDAAVDPRFHDNPLVVADPRIRFYAGVPIRAENGMPLGTLCVIDRVPRALGRDQLDALTALAHELESQMSLRSALDHAEKEQDERVQLTALLVHDLRNPLTSVIAGAACLEMDPALSEESREIVQEMIYAGERMRRMAFQLLDESAHARTALTPSFAPLDPIAFYQRVRSALTLNARLNGHRLHATYTSEARAGETIRTDEGLLRRLVDNLFDNAAKFSPAGTEIGFTMTVRRGEPMRIDITDSGPGIPEAERARIFDAGVRLGRNDAPRPAGWGLGLRFCKRAVEALGGTVSIGEASPRGAVFELTLPGLPATPERPTSDDN